MSEPPFRKKVKVTSIVWEFFDFKLDTATGDKYAECLICGVVLSNKSGATTSPMRHARRMHAEEYQRVRAERAAAGIIEPAGKVHKRKSIAWACHTLKYDPSIGRKYAECKFCGQELEYTGGTTSNLLRHSKVKHPKEFQRIAAEREAAAQQTPDTADVSPEEETVDGPVKPSRKRPLQGPPNLIKIERVSAGCALTQPVRDMLKMKLNSETPGDGGDKVNGESPISGIPLQTPTGVEGGEKLNREVLVGRDIPLQKTQTRVQSNNSSSHYNPAELDQAVLDFVICDNEPLSIVEQKGFKRLVTKLHSRYQLVSLQKLGQELLPQRYLSEKEKLVEGLRAVPSVSVSIDCWTSYSNKAFITITAHYISPDWELRTSCLKTTSDGSCHSVGTLASSMEDTFKEFDIEEKLSTVVSDNVIEISDLVEAMSANHQACFAYKFNKVIKDSIEGADPTKTIVKKVRDIVAYFNSSVSVAKNLSEIHQRRGNAPKALLEDLIPGWNATYDMLQSYTTQHDEVTTVLSLSGRHDLCLQPPEPQTLRAALTTLKPFYEAIQELTTDRYMPCSKIIPILKMITKLAARGDSALSKRLHENLLYWFSGWEEKSHLQLATLLDPRFKKSAFSSLEAALSAVERLKEEAGKNRVGCQWEPIQEDGASTDQLPGSSPQSTLWEEFDSECAGVVSVSETLSTVELEVERYLGKQPLQRKKDPLAWWKENGWSFPHLEPIAKDVLAIPATAVPGDIVFSAKGQSVSFKRSKLDSDNVNMVLFLNDSFST